MGGPPRHRATAVLADGPGVSPRGILRGMRASVDPFGSVPGIVPGVDRDLQLLHLEDSELDHELTLAHLVRGGLRVQLRRVDSEAEFLNALDHDWDAIISDYDLPGFSGLVALDLLKATGRGVPFILVSGEIGEDTAVEAMRNGASDYLLKNNLSRLVPALLHAVEATETRRARERADRELDASKQRLRELAQHLQNSIEQERIAIARHSDSDAVRTRVNSALETVTLAIDSSKRIMHNLRPAILEQGLVAALHWLATRFEKRTGIDCMIRLPAEAAELPAGVALVAYRTAQEALTNISKHAQATRARLDLSLAGGVLSLEISDNGRGLSADDLAKARSFGIRGLHERAGTVSGWIELSSSTVGTTMILSVPLNPAEIAAIPMPHGRDADDPSQWGTL